MSDTAIKNLVILGGGILLLGALLLERPGYLASPDLLGTLIVAELVLAAVCNYRQIFFPVVLGAFLWAGVGVPLASAWVMGRWFVLLIAAVAGFAIYIKDRNHYFSATHLVALLCVISAVISALVSAYPEEALLKAMSLLLLILYGASGVRLAVPMGRPDIFFGWLLRGCEVLTYLSAIAYFALRWEIFGNPNSLGGVMGVAVVPTLLWGFISAETIVAKRRLGFELVLALLLLLSSFARAGIAAGAIASIILCVTLRQYRLLIKGIAASAVLAVAVVMFVPLPESSPKWDGSQSVVSMFLYKGRPDQGLTGSRKGVWDQTWAVIKDNPWFGSGFGTSLTGEDLTNIQLKYTGTHIDTRVAREHGNSYLAISEWVGLLGVVPFYCLIVMVGLKIRDAFSRASRSQNVFSPLLPAAAILTAGLIDAAFEDWLFAVGYYLCIFFWAIAFILVDLLDERQVVHSVEGVYSMAEPRFLPVASGQ